MHTATYSPEDNKLRLYATERLDPETFAAAKECGFKWAPHQDLFVAPAWTPKREDFLLELAGEIGDEDTSLVERQEERAERFEGYSEKRLAEATAHKEGVEAITDGIPLGQPILVGHHSEKRARKDADKIERGMQKAVSLWNTSKYWTSRAQGAIHHAKYKERSDVRYRRIKKLESERRKHERSLSAVTKFAKVFENCLADATSEHIYTLCNQGFAVSGGKVGYSMHSWLREEERTGAQALEYVETMKASSQAHNGRWFSHIDNRLAYERAMLGESGGLEADKHDFKKGGRVLTRLFGREEWATITRVNKSSGVTTSLSTNRTSYPRVVSVEDVKGYEAPTAESAAAVKSANKGPALLNYRAPDGITRPHKYREGETVTLKQVEMTRAQYKRIGKDGKETQRIEGHKIRTVFVMEREGSWSKDSWCAVFLTDSKEHPRPTGEEPEDNTTTLPPVERVANLDRPCKAPERTAFDDINESLKGGVQVVAAPQLFPTPSGIARKMVKYAELVDGVQILEPSAGTGSIVKAIFDYYSGPVSVQAIEISSELCQRLPGTFEGREERHALGVDHADFLTWEKPHPSMFGRVIMNPPFERGADIKHIKHALTFLQEGGRLVALCANGPKQQRELQPLATHWEDLPPGSFKEQGTNVNVALVVIDKAKESSSSEVMEQGAFNFG
jgi:phospholipid N-methyltransferase